MSEEKKGISWGGLIKGLVATAAVVAGAELLFPGFIEGTVSAAKSIATSIKDAFTGIDTTKVVESDLAKNIGWLATKVGGIVLAASGIKYLMSEKQEAPEPESFAAQEDMKRMQALMVARMRAQGYQPAMPAASQQR